MLHVQSHKYYGTILSEMWDLGAVVMMGLKFEALNSRAQEIVELYLPTL
jgi:hypothetical protein